MTNEMKSGVGIGIHEVPIPANVAAISTNTRGHLREFTLPCADPCPCSAARPPHHLGYAAQAKAEAANQPSRQVT